MKLRTFVPCMVVLALSIPMFAADAKSPVMKPGKWQVNIATDMPNMPFKMPAFNTTVCVTKEMAEKPEPPKAKKDDCQISDYKLEGNVVTYSITCPKQNTSGTGNFTYDSDTYSGEVKLNMGDSEITQKHTGKYVGECDK